MVRYGLLASLLLISLKAFSQVSAPQSQDNTATPAAVAPASGGTVWTGPGPVGGVLLATPTATFAPPQTTVGISNAGRAGISNSTSLNLGVQSTAPETPYVYVPYTVPLVETPTITNPAGAAVSSEESTRDLLPSYYSDSAGAPPADGPSLAEIAARYGRGAPALQSRQNIRTYTNADIPRENAGLLTRIWVAEGRLPATAENSAPQIAANEPPARPGQQESQAQSSENAAPQSQQAQSESRHNQLPASSTLLPLLGLLGLASGGIGLWFRRRR